MDDQAFRQLLDAFDFSWRGYRRVRKGVMRRVSRHMQELGTRTVEAYLDVLEEDRKQRLICRRLLAVPISRFFRDRGLWAALEKEVLPALCRHGDVPLRVWFAGCACGEEVYSFKILWDCLEKREGTVPSLEILATDLNPKFLERAQKGVFSGSSLKEVTPELREMYFSRDADSDRYEIRPWIRQHVSWALHDLLTDPPPEGPLRILFLRNNLLTYSNEEQRRAVFPKLASTLTSGGYLVTGQREKLPGPTADLIPHTGYSSIYVSKSGTQGQDVP